MRLYDLFEATMPDHVPPGEESSLEVDSPEWLERRVVSINSFIEETKRSISYWKKVEGQKNPSRKVYAKRRLAELEEDLIRQTGLLEAVKKKLSTFKSANSASVSASTKSANLQNALYYVKTHCGEFLKEVKKTQELLWRGLISQSHSMVFVGHSRQDRKPRDSYAPAQILFDKCLKALGVTALRSKSIFTTSDREHAEEFVGEGGDVYMIFPIDGKYSFTYTNRADLTMESMSDVMDDARPWLRKVIKAVKASTFLTREQKQDHLEELSSAGPEDAEEVIGGLHGILTDEEVEPTMSLTDFRRKFAPQTQNLARAMKNQYEIYINGQYIAIHNEYLPQVTQYLRSQGIKK